MSSESADTLFNISKKIERRNISIFEVIRGIIQENRFLNINIGGETLQSQNRKHKFRLIQRYYLTRNNEYEIKSIWPFFIPRLARMLNDDFFYRNMALSIINQLDASIKIKC